MAKTTDRKCHSRRVFHPFLFLNVTDNSVDLRYTCRLFRHSAVI
ncbi:hypothetical protein ENTCAN_07878 [Enterobacter cancerogenus ATCC 35316]|nr:hypothetical protein ENTCAN_07878 [Enterobacter cancerogenus ATCC 35316]